MTSEKEKKPEAAELDDKQLDQATGGQRENDPERCQRCGRRIQPLYKGYCIRCRATLTI